MADYFVSCFICRSNDSKCGHREDDLIRWWERISANCSPEEAAEYATDRLHAVKIAHKRDMSVRQDSPPVTTPEHTAALHAQRGLGKIRGLRNTPKVQKAYATGPADIQRDELLEMVERGYGDIPQTDIPANWREVPGPRAYARSKW